LASSRNNFKLLKRESSSAGKVMSIESVDEDVLELCDAFDIKCVNPFFGKRKSVTDIVVKEIAEDSAVRESITPKEEPPAVETTKKGSIFGERKEISELWKGGPVVIEEKQKPSIWNKALKFLIIIVLASILGWVAVYVLPRAKIDLVLQKINWDFSGTVTVSSLREISSVNDSNSIELPGVLFIKAKNIVKAYPATGREQVERRATGTITVYNEYSSDPQVLVQNTRFSTPDGKVFRTNEKITVPGAKISDGKIVASSINVKVTADKPGEEYNVGPVERFRIPGFQGSPKYEAFYGSSSGLMTGGFVGEIKVPTEDDIAKAKEDVSKALEDNARLELSLSMPSNIKVLDKSSIFSMTKEEISKEAGKDGNFSVTADGELKIMGFKETDLISALTSKITAESEVDLVIHSHSLEESDKGYGEPMLDLAKSSMTFSLDFKSSWVRLFDPEKFKADAIGKNKAEITSLVYSVPGFKSGEVSLWPIWVRYAPKNVSKIVVDLDYTL